MVWCARTQYPFSEIVQTIPVPPPPPPTFPVTPMSGCYYRPFFRTVHFLFLDSNVFKGCFILTLLLTVQLFVGMSFYFLVTCIICVCMWVECVAIGLQCVVAGRRPYTSTELLRFAISRYSYHPSTKEVLFLVALVCLSAK